MASVLTAQVCSPPASTALNVPPGGVAWPWLLEPQQATVASTLIAHECPPPALTCTSACALAGATAASIDPTISAATALRIVRPIRASVLVVLGRGEWLDEAQFVVSIPGPGDADKAPLL